MTAEQAFDKPMNFGGAKLVDGRQYKLELVDITIRPRVVSYREEWKGMKGLSGVEYDKLTPENKAIVDNAPIEYWEPRDGKEPAPKDKFESRITFQFREPEADVKSIFLQYKMKENGFPSPDLRKFVTTATGITVDGNDFTWGDIFKAGDKFVGVVKAKSGGNGNLYEIEKNSLVREELAAPIVTGAAAVGTLSDNAKALYEFIKANLNGQPKGKIVEHLKTGAGGAIGPADDGKARYNNTFEAWTEIRKSGVKYLSDDGKTFQID